MLSIITTSGNLYRFVSQNYVNASTQAGEFAAKCLIFITGPFWHEICCISCDRAVTARDLLTSKQKMPKTKTALVRFVLAVACAVPALAITAGCSSTPTHESAGEYTTDSALTAKVKAALLGDPGLKSLSVSVTTYRSEVLLSGFVNSADQIQKAVSVTRGVEGVQSVKNDLHLKPQ
jgi:hyperosmotically inducible protein